MNSPAAPECNRRSELAEHLLLQSASVAGALQLSKNLDAGLLQDYAPLSRPGSAAEAALVAAVAHMSGSEDEAEEGGNSEAEISAMEGEASCAAASHACALTGLGSCCADAGAAVGAPAGLSCMSAVVCC